VSQDVAVYAASDRPPPMKKILAELRKRHVPVVWKPTFTAEEERSAEWKVGSLSPEGAPGPQDTIGISWEPLEDYMREEALEHPASSAYQERLRRARTFFQLSLPDSASDEGWRRLAYLVEALAGKGGAVVYEASNDRFLGAEDYGGRDGTP